MDTVVTFTECGFLQCLERRVLALRLLQRSSPIVDEARQFLVLLTQLADLLRDVGERSIKLVTRLALAELLLGQLVVPRLELFRACTRLCFFNLPVAIRKTLQSRLNLLGTGLLDALLLHCLVVLRRVLVPLLLPLGDCFLGAPQRHRRGLFALPGLLEPGNQFAQRHLELLDFCLVLVDVVGNFLGTLDRLFQILFPALPQFLGVLD